MSTVLRHRFLVILVETDFEGSHIDYANVTFDMSLLANEHQWE